MKLYISVATYIIPSLQVRLGGNVSYAFQVPWIRNATLRENILFDQPDNEDRFVVFFGVVPSKDYVTIANLKKLGHTSKRQWDTEAIEVAGGRYTSSNEVDPVMTIQLEMAESQEDIPIFLSLFALFEWTFYDAAFLELSILEYYLDDGTEVFPLLVDSFRCFVNLEKLSVEYKGTEFPFPPLQQENYMTLL